MGEERGRREKEAYRNRRKQGGREEVLIAEFPYQATDTSHTDKNGLEEACGGGERIEGETKEGSEAVIDGIPIEESLFEGDDIDDLELEDLDIVD